MSTTLPRLATVTLLCIAINSGIHSSTAGEPEWKPLLTARNPKLRSGIVSVTRLSQGTGCFDAAPSEQLIRVTFDRDKGLYRCDQTTVGADRNRVAEASSIIIITPTKAISRIAGRHTIEVVHPERESAIFDPLSVGLLSDVPDEGVIRLAEVVESLEEMLVDDSGTVSIAQADDGATVLSFRRTFDDAPVVVETMYWFSAKYDNLPVRHIGRTLHRQADGSLSKTGPDEFEVSVSWKSSNGTFVPEEQQSTLRVVQRPVVDGRIVPEVACEQVTTLRFDWEMVNDEIANQSVFSIDSVDIPAGSHRIADARLGTPIVVQDPKLPTEAMLASLNAVSKQQHETPEGAEFDAALIRELHASFLKWQAEIRYRADCQWRSAAFDSESDFDSFRWRWDSLDPGALQAADGWVAKLGPRVRVYDDPRSVPGPVNDPPGQNLSPGVVAYANLGSDEIANGIFAIKRPGENARAMVYDSVDVSRLLPGSEVAPYSTPSSSSYVTPVRPFGTFRSDPFDLYGAEEVSKSEETMELSADRDGRYVVTITLAREQSVQTRRLVFDDGSEHLLLSATMSAHHIDQSGALEAEPIFTVTVDLLDFEQIGSRKVPTVIRSKTVNQNGHVSCREYSSENLTEPDAADFRMTVDDAAEIRGVSDPSEFLQLGYVDIDALSAENVPAVRQVRPPWAQQSTAPSILPTSAPESAPPKRRSPILMIVSAAAALLLVIYAIRSRHRSRSA